MRLGTAKRIVRGQAVNSEERLEELERATEARLLRLEEAIISLKDVLLKIDAEKESLKQAKEQSAFEPFMKSGADFVKSLVEDEDELPKEEVKISMQKQNDEMERAIKLMRQKFGLPAKIGGKRKEG